MKLIINNHCPKRGFITDIFALFVFILATMFIYGCFNAPKKSSYHKQNHTSYPPDYPFESGVPLEHHPRVVVADDLYEAEPLEGGILHKGPKLVYHQKPEYPRLPLEAGIQGFVILDILLDESGSVTDVSVFKSDVSPVMEKSALESAKSFKFEPAERDGKGVGCKIKIPVHFWLY